MSDRPSDPLRPRIKIGALDDLARIGGSLGAMQVHVSEASRLADALRGPMFEAERLAELMRRPVLEAQLATEAMRGPLFDFAHVIAEQQQAMADATREALLFAAPSVAEIGKAFDSFRPVVGEAMRASSRLDAYFKSLQPDIQRMGKAIDTALASSAFQDALRAAETLTQRHPDLFATPAFEAFRDSWELAVEADFVEHGDRGPGLRAAKSVFARLPQLSPSDFATLVSILLTILIYLDTLQSTSEAEARLHSEMETAANERAAFAAEVRIALERVISQRPSPQKYVSLERAVSVRESPSSGAVVVARIEPRQLVSSVGSQGKWIRVEYLDGEAGVAYGWALKKYFKRVSPSL